MQPRWSKIVITGARPDWKASERSEGFMQVGILSKRNHERDDPTSAETGPCAACLTILLHFMLIHETPEIAQDYLVVLGRCRVGFEEGGGNGGGSTGLSPVSLSARSPDQHKKAWFHHAPTLLGPATPTPRMRLPARPRDGPCPSTSSGRRRRQSRRARGEPRHGRAWWTCGGCAEWRMLRVSCGHSMSRRLYQKLSERR